jgi:hypothetical protein
LEPVAPEPLAAEPVADWSENSRAEALPSVEPAAEAVPDVAGLLLSDSADAQTAEAPPEIAGLPREEPPSAVFPESAEPALAVPAQDSLEPCASGPILELAAVDDSAPDPATNAQVVERMPEVAPEPSPLPAAEPYSIPKFLTEDPSPELENRDRLIRLRTAAAAGAVIGAVLLIYFASSRELGLAAHPMLGASEPAATRAAPPEIPPSVAVRQAFVAEPLAYSAASEPLRSYRPPFVGFDFLDGAAPPPEAPAPEAAPRVAGQAEIPTDSVPERQIAPSPPAEETAALPALDADLAGLVRRGDALLKAGDIAAARSAYERAAAAGSAKAEIGVGKTYDPLVLAKLGARGVRGDPVQAASWYARAGEAGDEEGQQRLHALISGLSDCMLAPGACSSRKP